MEPLLPSVASSNKRILLVEDDYANRMFFTDYLRYCGYQVLPLSDGLGLSFHLKEFQPHVLLLDLGLPEIDGFELIQQIRAEADWQALPIVVISGYAFTADQSKSLALGVQAYLVKPVRLHDLVHTVAQFCVSEG